MVTKSLFCLNFIVYLVLELQILTVSLVMMDNFCMKLIMDLENAYLAIILGETIFF